MVINDGMEPFVNVGYIKKKAIKSIEHGCNNLPPPSEKKVRFTHQHLLFKRVQKVYERPEQIISFDKEQVNGSQLAKKKKSIPDMSLP